MTTGLVVVSHSRALADAAVALAAEMVHGKDLALEVAAGLDAETFGTDAVAIASAIAAADRGDGVVVLMDLGSAVLSAELALDLLEDPDQRDRVLLCPAPLVEGLVAAVVAAASGAGRDEVAAEAVAGLAGKESHLGVAAPVAVTETSAADVTASFTVTNPHGLHARPAARLVSEARDAEAAMEIRNRTTGSAWVPASSLTKVATLGALQGHEIEVRASGAHARQAVDRMITLAARAFDETAPPAAAQETGAREAGAQPASPGIGIGPAWHLRDSIPDIPDVPSQGPDAERRRLDQALDDVRAEVRRLRTSTGGGEAGIFDAHLLLLDDDDLLDDARTRIAEGTPAPQAWEAASSRVAAEFAALGDPYLQARAADVRAVSGQVLRSLLGVTATPSSGTGVLIAHDLTPAEAAGLDPATVAGIVLAAGSPTAHGAILARARGIPAVVGAGAAVLEVATGTTIALDGRTGETVVSPSPATLAAFAGRATEQAGRRERALSAATGPAVTPGGVTIGVGANVGSADDALAAAANGADHAGLVRTEFLFLGRDEAPGVDEQVAAYRAVAAALGGRRITLRTLDVGGDKPLPYLPSPHEDNPFLGVRGLRHSLAHPALLADQLTAIATVARETPVSVMFPMVSTLAELHAARRALDEAIARTGPGRPPGLQVGIMVEVPAAALKAATFAPHIDFASIGTNDLTQYALAAERGNPAVAALSDALDPGVLRLIDATCRGVGSRATVAVCGELAADEMAVPVLVGLGVRSLSVAPPAVPAVKEAVRGASPDGLARHLLDLPDAAAVRAALRQPGRVSAVSTARVSS
ncbi:phosphoenolpyruvate--protein phosphotransferase [Actinoplanes sp. NBRC 103695]|uniref:phosphoenolpyruvate--protein phosphotransferase n=1 Tax=Actinoplanes sp. NBRC 103695 TaxID=3032202 RepID=UPI0024A0CA76|nr:phosphoenolpyruvate--protein phosphotransferase [Actinoplanes sp. NBRC 103695]GLY96595.1 multiphosphoryl transfer protein [Actinoplanes sp. NBRC 103695]